MCTKIDICVFIIYSNLSILPGVKYILKKKILYKNVPSYKAENVGFFSFEIQIEVVNDIILILIFQYARI
jgi:hypothetical protein